MENISFEINEQTKNKIIDFYKPYQVENNGSYIIFFAKYEKVSITIYQSKKGYKALFSGENALYEAKIFNQNAQVSIPKEKEKISFITFEEQCGSDEVGFGDFFGPLVVVGVYYSPSLNNLLDNIKDSKKLTDEFILKFVPTILDKVIFSKLTVHNEKYNSLINKGYNMNKIKAILHNQVLVNLSKKVKVNKYFIDQFCTEENYFYYIQNEKEKITNITFLTKGESYFPSVALASMIARYSFLKEMEVLNQKYHLTFPKGASNKVDEFAKLFVDKYSLEEIKKVCKTNFSNYQLLISNKF